MIQNNCDDEGVNEIAEAMGFPYLVQISTELSEQIKPNEFLAKLGSRYSERIEAILSILKGNMNPDNAEFEGSLSKQYQVIPYSHTKGPFIKEELISIRAEVKDDGGKKVILLSAVPDDN
jgi:hypothetical protein